jgi:hypothetical protein
MGGFSVKMGIESYLIVAQNEKVTIPLFEGLPITY